MPSVYHLDTPKAIKEHRCCECFGVIPKGEIYHSHNGVWDGRGATFKVCVDCDLLRAEMDEGNYPDELTPFGYLGERISEEDSETILRFIAIMRKRRAAIHKSWEKLEAELLALRA